MNLVSFKTFLAVSLNSNCSFSNCSRRSLRLSAFYFASDSSFTRYSLNYSTLCLLYSRTNPALSRFIHEASCCFILAIRSSLSSFCLSFYCNSIASVRHWIEEKINVFVWKARLRLSETLATLRIAGLNPS